jgi:hypothetical protein
LGLGRSRNIRIEYADYWNCNNQAKHSNKLNHSHSFLIEKKGSHENE